MLDVIMGKEVNIETLLELHSAGFEFVIEDGMITEVIM